MPTLFTLSIQVLAVTLGHLYIGYGLTYYAITQNTMAYILDFQDSSQKGMIDGIINALLPIGAAIGATISSPLIHILSFRSTFILNDSIAIIIGCLSLYQNIYCISFCRLIYGFVIGINCTITVQYIHHIVPLKYNGFFGGMAQCLMMVGLTLGFAIQWICLRDDPIIYDPFTDYGFIGFNNWRIVFFFPTIPCVLRLASFLIFFRGKLAYEYYEIGKIEDASRILMQHYVMLNSEMDQDTQLQSKLDEIERELNKQHKHLSLVDLFTKKYRRQMIICCIFSFFQQWAGINAVNFYAGTILEQMTNNNYTIINMANVGNGIVSTISAIVSSYAINAHGRKIMLLVGNGCCFVSLTILSILMVTTEGKVSLFIEISYMICLFSFIIGYSLSLGPVFWVYISEVLPPKGIDVVNCVNWIACAVLAQVFPMVAASFEMYYNFMFFGLVCLLTELLVHYLLIETKGLTKGEIQRKLQQGRGELIIILRPELIYILHMVSTFGLLLKVFFISQGYLFVGYTTTYFAITQNSIAYILGYNDSDDKSVIAGVINAILPIGAAVGCAISSYFVKWMKFRNTFILCDIVGLLATSISMVSDIYCLGICRFIFGVLVGVNSAITIQYIGQIVPLKTSGVYNGTPPVLMMLGLTLGFVFQWIFIYEQPNTYSSEGSYGFSGFNNWRIIYGFPYITLLTRLISLIFFYKTNLATEYLQAGLKNEAQKEFEELYQYEDQDESKREDFVKSKMNEYEGTAQKQEEISFSELLGPKYRKLFIVCMILGLCQQWMGINGVNYFASAVLGEMTGNNEMLLNLANIMNGLFSLISTTICILLINSYGRKLMLLRGNALCVVSLIFVTISLFFKSPDNIALQIACFASLFIYINAFSMSLGPLFWVYISETMPPRGIDVVGFFNWIACASVVQLFPIVTASVGIQYNFAFYSLMAIVAQIVIKFFVIESKGMSKLAIQIEFTKIKTDVDPL